MPNFVPIDYGEQQQKAVASNQAALPGIENLATSVDTFNEAELARQMGISTGQFRAMKAGTTGSIEDLLKGNIPSDVLDAIQRQGSERGLFLGVGGAPASRSWTAADLGRTSLNMFSSGLDALSRWTALNKQNSFDVTSMFITPQQQVAFAVEERNTQFERNWLSNQIKAMPDPVIRGFHDMIMSLVTTYVGSLGGGKGGSYTGWYHPTDYFKEYNLGAGQSNNFGQGPYSTPYNSSGFDNPNTSQEPGAQPGDYGGEAGPPADSGFTTVGEGMSGFGG